MNFVFPEKDPNNRVIKFPNVRDPEAWPRAPSGFICLFEAILLLGPALSSEWSGNELDTVDWPESPRAAHIALSQHARIRPKAARQPEWKPGQPRPEPGETLADYLRQHNAHVVSWYVEHREHGWRENQAALKRLRAAVDWLAQKCRDGHIESYARLRSGGSLYPVQSWEWNRENILASWVSSGGPARRFPEIDPRYGTVETFLFFQRAQIMAAREELGGEPSEVPMANLGKLSPYLQLAVHLAIKNRYFDVRSCETKDVREAVVRDAWQGVLPDVPMTNYAVQSIAKVMNFPNAEAIERGKRGGKSKKGVNP